MRNYAIGIILLVIVGGVFIGVRNGFRPGLQVFVEMDRTEIAYGETLVVKSKLVNNTPRIVSAKFSTTCTEPTLSLNGEPARSVKVCGQAITEVKILPFGTRNYEDRYVVRKSFQALNGVPLIVEEPGVYRVKAIWKDWESSEVDLKVRE